MKSKGDTRLSKEPLSIRIDPRHVDLAKQIAERKSIGYQTLMRMWIVEGIERELEAMNRRTSA